jgi:ferredoxin
MAEALTLHPIAPVRWAKVIDHTRCIGCHACSTVEPFASSDPDTGRIWWTDAGVHQNLSFAVQPDPVSGMHCWHQAVRVRKAEPGDRYGDVSVDTSKSRQAYAEWLAKTRPAQRFSPDGTRRPYWLLRPLKPGREVFRLPARG